MDLDKLNKLKRELSELRRSPQKPRTLERIAARLGRKEVKRGKEHVWESTEFKIHPLSIPHHGGKDLSPGTQRNIINFLESYDIAAWEERLNSEDEQDTENEGKY
ncbi:MAG: type II toxin-antitoxin system HicA family toxin [Rhodomicrobiaceae bacterium]